MQRIDGHFEELHFTESKLGPPMLDARTMKISVTGVLPLKNYPMNNDTFHPLSGDLVFIGVTKSTRKVTEYIGDPKHPQGFKEERVVVDIDVSPDEPNATRFMLEGILQEPVAWVEWEVVAAGFQFHTD